MKILEKISREQEMRAVATAERLVSITASETRSRTRAHEIVAAKLGRSASWLRNFLSRGGSIPGEIERALDALLIKHLEAQLVRLQAELDVARQSGAHPACAHVGEIEALLARTKALLNGGTP